MNKFATVMIAVALGAVTLSGAQPARASHTDVCVGQGTATGAQAVNYYLLSQPSVTVTWSFGLVGACASLGTLSISLNFSGWCEFGSGSGNVNGHSVNFTAANGNITWTGGAVGHMRIAGDSPDPCVYRSSGWLITAYTIVPA